MTGPACRIAIRADGGGQTGLGHVMRCGALAGALAARRIGVDWITVTPSILPDRVRDLATVHDISAAGDETAAIADTLVRSGAHLLVGDWKDTDASRVAALRRQGWPVVLVGSRLGGAVGDLHVHQSFAAPAGAHTPPELSGAGWLLLDAAYRDAPPRRVGKTVHRILVSLGGTDTPVLQSVRAALATDPRTGGMEIDCRTPGGTREAGCVRPLHEALATADIGILAGGTTLHEAAALGLPVICIPVAANQHERARQLQGAGLGIVIDPEARCFERRLTDALAALAADPARRARMARRGQSRVDGRGADRLAELIVRRFLPAGGESQ